MVFHEIMLTSGLNSRQTRTDAMLRGNFSNREKRVLEKALDALGEENVDRLVDGGITIKLRGPFESEAATYTAMYVPDKKMMVMSSTRMDKETLIHEFGHALDDLAAPDPIGGKAVLKSELDQQLQQLHHEYKERVESLPWYNKLLERGGGLWSDYATTNPQEYLAEGVRLYASSERGKEKLLRDDPKLAHYVEAFLNPERPELEMFLVA